MPRKTPVPDEEIAVCKRLRDAREHAMIPRTSLAEALNIKESRLNNYERARVPLPATFATEACAFLEISPLWLSTGLGPQSPYTDIASKFEHPHKGELLSQYVMRYLEFANSEVSIEQADTLLETAFYMHMEECMEASREILTSLNTNKSKSATLAEKFPSSTWRRFNSAHEELGRIYTFLLWMKNYKESKDAPGMIDKLIQIKRNRDAKRSEA